MKDVIYAHKHIQMVIEVFTRVVSAVILLPTVCFIKKTYSLKKQAKGIELNEEAWRRYLARQFI